MTKSSTSAKEVTRTDLGGMCRADEVGQVRQFMAAAGYEVEFLTHHNPAEMYYMARKVKRENPKKLRKFAEQFLGR